VYVVFQPDLQKLLRKALINARSLREIAGLIVGAGRFLSLIEVRNTARRLGSFQLHLGDWRKVKQACKTLGLSVSGTFHSHVASDAIPSRGDIEGANDGDLMLILDATGMEFALWRIKGRKAVKLPCVSAESGDLREMDRNKAERTARPRRS
jgi:proteasome lid subunit RPN8/RPN11